MTDQKSFNKKKKRKPQAYFQQTESCLKRKQNNLLQSIIRKPSSSGFLLEETYNYVKTLKGTYKYISKTEKKNYVNIKIFSI